MTSIQEYGIITVDSGCVVIILERYNSKVENEVSTVYSYQNLDILGKHTVIPIVLIRPVSPT